MTDDQFAVIGYDENGRPKLRYCLDPREVTIIRDPERGDEVIGYVWEPVGPVPSPIRTDPPRLTDDEFEDLKQRWIAAQQQRPTWRYPSVGVEDESPQWWERGWVQVLIIAAVSVGLIGLIVVGAVR